MITLHTLLHPRRFRSGTDLLVHLVSSPRPTSADETLVIRWLTAHGPLPRLALVEMLAREMLHSDLRAAAVDVGLWGRVVYEHQAARLLDAMEGRVIVSRAATPAAA